MAQYDVDIQLAIRNKNALQGLQRELNAISDAVDAINDKSIDVTGKRRENAIKDLYKNVEDASLKVLEKVDKATTTAHKNQQKVQLKLEDDLFQDKLDKINKLADAEIAASKDANEAALKDFDQRLENRVARRKGSLFGTATARERAGAAVSAGAFPLLFGGGPGMALGGALGGALTGKTFGPAAIALQVLGGFFDELAAKAATLGQALNVATADVDAIVESLGVVGSPVQETIQSLEELAGEQVALQEATRQLSFVVGDEGIEALTAFGDASTRFGNALTRVTTQILAAIARFSGPAVQKAMEALEFEADLSAARASKDPRQQLLQAQLQNINVFEDVTSGRQRAGIEADMVDLQRQIRTEEEGRLETALERARAGSVEHTIAKNNLALAKLDGDLTSDRIYNLERANIFQEARKKLMQEGADVKLIELERDGQLLALANKRNALIDSTNEKTERQRKRDAAAFERQEQRLRDLELRGDAQREREAELAGQRIDKYSDQLRLLEAQINGTEDQVRLEIDLANAAGEVERNYVKRIFAAKQTLEQLKEQRKVFKAIGDTIQTGVVDGITAAIDQTRTLGEVASNVLRTIANQLLRLGVNQLFRSFGFGGGGGSKGLNVDLVDQYMGERALGGPVGAGRPYMVGERGPELFVPGAQGNIVPNNAMGGANVTVNVDASGSSVEGNADQASQLGKAIGVAVQQELIKQKRPGGLLAS